MMKNDCDNGKDLKTVMCNVLKVTQKNKKKKCKAYQCGGTVSLITLQQKSVGYQNGSPKLDGHDEIKISITK